MYDVTVLPPASFAVMVMFWLAPAVCVALPVMTSTDAAPTVPVAVKVTGVRAPEDAVSVFTPAVFPRVHEVRVAMPEEFVVLADAGSREPPPEATANVTDTLGTTLPPESVTSTEGAVATALPAVAVWLFPALIAMVAAEPTPVGCTVVVADVRPDDANVSA